MSAYLARLKQLDSVKNSHYTPNTVPSKPSKPPFDPFEGTHPAHIEKKIIDDVEISAPPEPSEITKLETLKNRQRETRRQKVLALLEETPAIQRAYYTDAESDPDNVILAIAIRHVATLEMLIDRARYDPFKLMQLIGQHGQVTH